MGGRKLDESNVDEFIENLRTRTNGTYIHQGVAFNKNCRRQMALLKRALLDSSSFSGLIKEMLAIRYHDGEGRPIQDGHINENNVESKDKPIIKKQNDFSGWI
ncbi:hypothetical protein [Bacillus salipaludis]|uniref:hypothetical protein n=1 Tax=Bacillus salipaludis TaxID=2547811 RepID=UPI002E1B66EA|nr:hypothetical protein [Bacillus salipaludis]